MGLFVKVYGSSNGGGISMVDGGDGDGLCVWVKM